MSSDGSPLRPRRCAAAARDLALVVLVATVFFMWLGRVELMGPDEARHAEIAREMLVGRSFLTPELHGEPYYDKPAAYYWLAAASFALFGLNEFAARLPAVLAALTTIAAASRFAARAYSSSVARLVVVALTTMPAFVVLGRYGSLDMPLTATLTVAFTSLGLWWIERRSRPPYAFYAFIAVAVLIKGPVAAVQAAVAIAVLAVIAVRDPQRSPAKTAASLAPLRGLLLALAIVLPWYVAAAAADPDYISTFLWSHNFERFAGSGPGASHWEPWWFYLAMAPVLLMPWTPWAAEGIAQLRRRESRSDASSFCAVWAGAIVSVYLPAQSKLATYLLPATVPLICVAASALEQRFHATGPSLVRAERTARIWAIGFGATVSAAGAAACVYVAAEHAELTGRLWFALPALLALPLAVNLHYHGAAQRSAATIALAALALLTAAYGVAGDIVGKFKGMRKLAGVIATELPPTTELWSFRSQPHAATFYTGKFARELGTGEQIAAVLASDPPAGVFLRRRDLAHLGPQLPAGVVERWSSPGGRILLSNAAAAIADRGSDLTP